MSGRPLVLVADDHAAMRAGVRLVLERAGHDVVEAADGPAAVAAAVEREPDACLLDIDMPGGGIQAARAIVAQVPAARVVMLTVSIAEDDVIAALRAGAYGYLVKGRDDGSLPDAVGRILAGEPALPPRFVALLLDQISHTASRSILLEDGRRIRLTRREAEVVDLLSQGCATNDVADALHLSPVTVRRHISDLVQRLGAPSREAALAMLDRAAPAAATAA